MATTYLSRTQITGSTDAAKKFTVSAWVKKSNNEIIEVIWASGTGGTDGVDIYFNNSDLLCYEASNGSENPEVITNRKFRDPGAWYHIVVAVDTTQATDTNRVKMYINGIQETSFGTTAYPTLNYEHAVGTSSDTMNIARGIRAGGSLYFNGVMAHLHYTEGQVYAASSFGSTDGTSGIWVPNNAPSVTYGNNGLFLQFASGALGTDSSGNSNTMAVTGTMTTTLDNAKNNFCTMNSLDNFYPAQTFTHGNTTIQSANKACPKGTIGLTSGKWYWEGKAIVTTSGTVWTIGISSWETINSTNDLGSRANEWSYYGSDGNSINSGSGTSYGDSYDTGDIIGVALDLTNSKLYFSKNGVWQNSGVPTSGGTGTGALSITAVGSTPLEAYFPAAGASSSSQNYTWSFNFGNGYFGTTAITSGNADDAGEGDFEYDVPAGYYALCTNNLGDQS